MSTNRGSDSGVADAGADTAGAAVPAAPGKLPITVTGGLASAAGHLAWGKAPKVGGGGASALTLQVATPLAAGMSYATQAPTSSPLHTECCGASGTGAECCGAGGAGARADGAETFAVFIYAKVGRQAAGGRAGIAGSLPWGSVPGAGRGGASPRADPMRAGSEQLVDAASEGAARNCLGGVRERSSLGTERSDDFAIVIELGGGNVGAAGADAGVDSVLETPSVMPTLAMGDAAGSDLGVS